MEEDPGGAIIAMKAKDQRENLSPSRGEAMEEEEEGGGLSPPRFRWHQSATGGHHHHHNLHQQLHRHHHQLFPPLCSGVTPLLPAVISI